MNLRFLVCTLLASIFAAAYGASGADVTSSDRPATFVITVVEPADRRPGDAETFNRIDRVFTEAFEARHWPVKIKVERFAANNPTSDTELRVYFQDIREESPGDLTFRAWMVLFDAGKKRDLGVIRFRSYPRAGQPMQDALDDAVRGAALEAIAKIEPILFPHRSAPGK